MQTIRVSRSEPVARHGGRVASEPTASRQPCAPAGADAAFVALLQAYRCSGGLARADDVAALLEHRRGPFIAVLARSIVERRVISFEWQAQTWLPWFQFARPDPLPEPALAAVLAELTAVYDGWELACWFVRPNSALAGRTPLQVRATDPAALLQAARVDRYAANG